MSLVVLYVLLVQTSLVLQTRSKTSREQNLNKSVFPEDAFKVNIVLVFDLVIMTRRQQCVGLLQRCISTWITWRGEGGGGSECR